MQGYMPDENLCNFNYKEYEKKAPYLPVVASLFIITVV